MKNSLLTVAKLRNESRRAGADKAPPLWALILGTAATAAAIYLFIVISFSF